VAQLAAEYGFTNLDGSCPDVWRYDQGVETGERRRQPDSLPTPVETLKGKSKVKAICEQFGARFRPIHQVQKAFDSRPRPDEALSGVHWEYKDRGKKGYDLTALSESGSVTRRGYTDF